MQVDDLVSILLDSPVLVGIVVVILGLIFFVYLFLRRTATAFREGMQGK
jgi:hypothetical protein